jgi:tetratricopeptide (TPR) repeat protein
MIIYGLGGSGKSTLALEFAYRALAHRSLVFWVPAISQESFERAYRDIGVRLRIPGVSDDDADIKKLVKDALSSRSLGKWLMIVDNADDSAVLLGTANANPTPASLKDCLPHSDSGTILFTTRNRKVAGDLMLSNVLELSDMSKAEASQLLARWLAKQALLDDRTAVDQLLKLLTYLPLAIVQAAAFINNNDITISGYVSLFQQSGAEVELFNEQFEDPLKYREMNNTVARTWHISFDHLHRHDQLATHYLSFMACINRTDIPQSLLPSGDSTLVQQVKALGTLAGYAFITERQQPVQDLNRERFFDMHRLVHMASAWWLEGQHERATWMGRTVTRLHDVIPRGGHEGMRTWSAYLSHAVYVARLIEDQTAGASLLDRVGRCQVSLGQYSAAESTHRQALSLREKSLGKEHSQTIMSINEVALALHVSGKYKEAEVMHRQSQALTVKVRGPKHRESLVSTSNLAAVLNSQGKYEEAEAMNRQTLMQREVVLGREHPDTIMSLSALAVVLTNQGKYEEAEAMNRQTLAQQVNLLGLEHPHTLRTMANLAGTLSYLHKYGEAEALLRQTLALKTKILGREHPHTLVSVHSLANILSNLHRHDESMILYRRAIAWYAVVLGNEHPTTITCIQHYYTALALQEQDQRTESQSASDSSAPARKTKESRLVRGLAKMGIKGSIFSAG